VAHGPCSGQFRATSSGWPVGVAVVAALLPAVAFPQSPPPAAIEADRIDEIIVTARKIEESVQDVPMSVQVLPGEFLDASNLSRMYELQFNVPGLVVNSIGLFGVRFALRGVSDQSVGRAVAAHLNGVYLAGSSLPIDRLFDMERIEVLKGPQGTLYGRNATGGSINFITRQPEDGFSAGIEGAYGSFATARVQGHVNMPVRNAALRLAFIASDGDGYIRNSIDHRRFAEEDFWGVRASATIDIGEAARLQLVAQHGRDDGASSEVWTPRPDHLPDPRDIRLTTVTLENPYLVVDNDFVSLNLEYELGFGTFRSVSGYGRSQVRNLDDCAGIPLFEGCIRGARPLRHEQWSQEIQLLLPGTGAVEGLVGAYYFKADRDLRFHTLIPRVDPNPIYDYHAVTSEIATAVFGQSTLHMSERLSASIGLRLSSEKSRLSTIGSGVEDSPSLLVAGHDSDDLSWRLDLKFAPTVDTLLYAGVATGYKSGGFTTALSAGEPDSFDPENVTAFEVGGKSRWMNGRLTLNAAAFYYDYKDLQVSTVTSRGSLEVDNAARAEVYGLDAEALLKVSGRLDASVGVVWIPKREYVEFSHALTGDTLSGNTLIRAPEWTASAAIGYEHPVQGHGMLSGRLEYNYRSSHFYTKENQPQFAQEGFGLVNLLLRFEAASRRWYLFASGRNLTNEDYFNQVFLQSSPGYPDTYEAGAGWRF
jgi:iron complex outermembrane recepter protein